jgi:large subunit ribosomal protein L7/L12
MYDPDKEYDKIAEARHLACALVLAIRGRFGTGAEDKANVLEALALECMHRLDDLEVARVVLAAVGEKKIEVIKEVRALTGLGLKEAKELVEAAPTIVGQAVPMAQADAMKHALESAGASVIFKSA